MMEKRSSGILGLHNPAYSSGDTGMNIPVTSNSSLSQLSPYLNFDPNYLDTIQPEFITLDGAAPRRGRFELAFSQIGGLVLIGASIGSLQGLYQGIKETKLQGHSGRIRGTQILNHVVKRCGVISNTLGTVAVMYSGIGCLLYWRRGKHEDHINTLAAGTLTGLLYKSTAGLRKCGIGGLVGLALSATYAGVMPHVY